MIEVLQTLPLNTVQDLGRFGFRAFGIGTAGAMDTVALAAGNLALGNAADCAGIEFQLLPASLRFNADTTISITGADCNATLDGKPVLPWWTLSVRKGQTLVLNAARGGVRVYLAVAGGIDVPQIMGSRSTQIRDGFGGFEGRALQVGDILPVSEHAPIQFRDPYGIGLAPARESIPAPFHSYADVGDLVLRVIRASEAPQFTDASLHNFFSNAWTVTVQSNRMGYRLDGEALQRPNPTEMRSQAIVTGVVQVPPSGQPIIQLSDGNSAGGYPKIAHVIRADLWRLAQAAPGTRLRFLEVSLDTARAAAAEQKSYLDEVSRSARYLRLAAKS